MVSNEDLREATTQAVRQMISFLVTQKHLSRNDAYMLTSVACDLDVTQLVDTKVGVHVMCPKMMFTQKEPSRLTSFDFTCHVVAPGNRAGGQFAMEQPITSPTTLPLLTLPAAPRGASRATQRLSSRTCPK